MADQLFDAQALKQHRRRALAQGPRLFLAERSVQDIAERLTLVRRRFARPVLFGCPDPAVAEPLIQICGPLQILPDLDALLELEPGETDLLILLGQLDTADDPPGVLRVLRHLLAPDALLIGVVPGNDILPALRTAMLAADRASGTGAAPRTHPRLEASAFAGLVADAGFLEPVIDIDRVRLRYRRLDDLVADLRGMGATNSLRQRSRRPLGRVALEAARAAFADLGDERGTIETLELIHFAAWTPKQT